MDLQYKLRKEYLKICEANNGILVSTESSVDESYKKVYEAMKKDNILRQDDIDYIDNKNVKSKKYER